MQTPTNTSRSVPVVLQWNQKSAFLSSPLGNFDANLNHSVYFLLNKVSFLFKHFSSKIKRVKGKLIRLSVWEDIGVVPQWWKASPRWRVTVPSVVLPAQGWGLAGADQEDSRAREIGSSDEWFWKEGMIWVEATWFNLQWTCRILKLHAGFPHKHPSISGSRRLCSLVCNLLGMFYSHSLQIHGKYTLELRMWKCREIKNQLSII